MKLKLFIKVKSFVFFNILFFFFATNCIAQTKIQLISSLIEEIYKQQLNADSNYFPKGIFPVYRQFDKNKKSIKPDDNIFYNALICYTLKKYYPKLTVSQQMMVDSIYAKTVVASKFYKNTKERNTYNFWKTNPHKKVFPNSGWINWFDEINALPDDLDDSVMMLLANAKDSVIAAELHLFMQNYTNKQKSTIKNTFNQYKELPAYSTWFGEKMPIDFDGCVMTNILLMVQHYNLKWTKADSASLQYITEVIQNNHHITHPHFVSPHYAKTSIFLYHVSRLMSEKEIPQLEVLKPQLIENALKIYHTKIGIQEKIILITTLKRFGYKSLPVMILGENWAKELAYSDEAFFIANMASMAKKPFKQIIGNAGIGKFYYYCTAYNFTLLLESLLED